MIDKEKWNIRTDTGQMEKLIRYNMTVHYHEKYILKKSFSSKVKQSTVFFSMNDNFLIIRN